MTRRCLRRTLIAAMLSLVPALAHAQAQYCPDPVPYSGAIANATAPYPWPGSRYGAPTTVDYGPIPNPGYGLPQFPSLPVLNPNPLGGGDYKENEYAHEDDDCFHIILSASYMPMFRSRMKKSALAVADPSPIDDGVLNITGAPVILDFRDPDAGLQEGVRAAIGCFHQDQMLEATGFYVARRGDTETVVRQGQITSFFYNPPVGFEGTNASLWDNADVMSISFSNALTNAELNYRCFFGGCGMEVDLLIGVRFLDQLEKMQIFTDDDSLQFGQISETIATYTSRTNNRLIGGQLGGGIIKCVTDHLSLAATTRLGLLANYADMSINLVRGDGVVGIDSGQQKWAISTLVDSGLFVHWNGTSWRVRAGYQAIWLWGVATAQDQVDFNLENIRGRGDISGSVLYHGPTIALDVVF